MRKKDSGFTLIEVLLTFCIIMLADYVTGISRWNIWFSHENVLEKSREHYPTATKVEVVERNLYAPSIIRLSDARNAVIITCNLKTNMAQDYTFSDCK